MKMVNLRRPPVGVNLQGASYFGGMADVNDHVARVAAAGGGDVDEPELTQFAREVVAMDPAPSLAWSAACGYEAGTLFALDPEDGSGDFAVTRAGTTAFTQTEDGYWRPAAANEPRFTYTNGVRGLLTENAATRLNADPYSLEKESWIKSGVRVEGDPATAGSELVVNGDFSNGLTGWSGTFEAVVTDGSVFITRTTTGYFGLTQSRLTIGKLYKFEIDLISTNATTILLHNNWTGNNYFEITKTAGKKTWYFVATSTFFSIEILGNGSVTNYDNVSVKEVSGFDCPFVDANGINTKQGRKLVATANNGSVKLTTPVAVTAATSYVNSVYIKRLVGTGTIYLVDVNNTDRAVTVTSEWTRVQYAAAAAGTTSQLGIKMAMAGDEVMVCYMPIEAGTTATSPIGGTEGSTQTRNADVQTVNVPAGVTQIILTNMNDVETIVTSFSSPYQIPVGTWKSIIMK